MSLVLTTLLLLLCCFSCSRALRYEYGDGSYYVGSVDEDGKPSGIGKFYNTTGALEYEGQFWRGQAEGNGTWYGLDGSRLEGNFRRGRANGRGVLRAKNGDRTEGDFADHLPDGLVRLQRANGERIEGQFRRGLPHGRVVWRGRTLRLEGAFRMGRPHGHAEVFDQHGKKIFEGKFVNGKALRPMPHNMNVNSFRFNSTYVDIRDVVRT